MLRSSEPPHPAHAENGALQRRDWTLLMVLTLSCVGLIAAAWSYYRVQTEELEKSSQRTVFSVAEGKARLIANWRAERVGDGEVIGSASVVETAKRLLEGRGDAADAHNIRDLMRRLSTSFLYKDVMLVDSAGSVRLRLEELEWGDAHFRQSARASMARMGSAAGRVVLTDLTRDTRDGKPRIALVAPVEQLGAFVLEIDPELFLYPYLATWTGGGRTGETLLVRLDNGRNVDLSPRRYAPDKPLLSTRPLGVKIPSMSVLDAGWNVQHTDYRGVPVIATVRHIPGSPWYVVSKVDVAEVDAPINRIGWEALLLTALVALVNACGGALVVWHRKFRLQREREALFFAISNETPALLWMESRPDGARFMNQPLKDFLGREEWWTGAVHATERDRVKAACSNALRDHMPWSDNCLIRRADGEYRNAAIQAIPQFDRNKRLLRMSGSVLDTTERKRAEDGLRVANATLDNELRDRIRKEEEIRKLTARLIGAREEERTRLARELHDGLSQQIAAVSIGIANLKRAVPPENTDIRDNSDRIHQKLVQLADSVRAMSHDLHPPLLALRGLGAAVEECCEEWSAARGLEIAKTIEGDFEALRQDVALNSFRIVQEGLQNAIKHSAASSITLHLEVSDDSLFLSIRDDGVGFDSDEARSRGGLGLLSMRERARLMNGALEVNSTPGGGTELKLSVPVRMRTEPDQLKAAATGTHRPESAKSAAAQSG